MGLSVIKCTNCGGRMPIEAKFCGFCGDLIVLPIWESLEAEAFIIYKDFLDDHNSIYMKYEVLRVENNIIEFKVTKGWSSSNTKNYYLYVGKDRLLRKSTSFSSNRYKGPLENLRPVKKFTSLWVDVTRIDVGDVVMISYTPHVVKDIKEKAERNFYVLKPIDNDETIMYYDKKTGLLWEVFKNGKENRRFHSAWKNI